MIKVTLPIPHAKLSPNARCHWAVKSKIAKKHREKGYYSTWKQHPEGFCVESYKLAFYWPDKRRRDRDNASTCCKNYLDGIADFLGQDDSEWGFDGVEFHFDRYNPRLEVHFFNQK